MEPLCDLASLTHSLFQMYSVVLFHLILALCAASSWSCVSDYSIPLSSGSPTVEIPINYCSTALPSEVLQLCVDFEENWECSWIVNDIPIVFDSTLVISSAGTSIDVNVTTVCSGPIHVACAINQNNDVISIEIKECIYFLLYTCNFHVLRFLFLQF